MNMFRRRAVADTPEQFVAVTVCHFSARTPIHPHSIHQSDETSQRQEVTVRL